MIQEGRQLSKELDDVHDLVEYLVQVKSGNKVSLRLKNKWFGWIKKTYNSVKKAFKKAKEVVTKVVDGVTWAYDKAKTYIKKVIKKIKEWLDKVAKFAKSILKKVTEKIASIVENKKHRKLL